MIHPTAIIAPRAELDGTVEVGPYAVIDAHVKVGPQCVIGPYVYLTGHTVIGSHNVFHAGCVIGDMPQDLKYKGQPTRLRIGDHNVFREHTTVHRSNKLEEETTIGSHNFLMAHSHVGHNAHVGNHVILANGALLAGHTIVQDRAIISGNCLIHQFTRVGALALMQGGAAVSKDVPPCTIAWGQNRICGLNVVGLRRAGLSSEERLELKRLYRVLFRSDTNIRQAVARARVEFKSAWARVILDFVSESSRGVCVHSRITQRDEIGTDSSHLSA
ncbi:MAG TPA: acyl-ACP--UDP-N-acetylglucosamine O-acyltransferase [Verrucomicrobiota bacterium]|nr:acyl-ACP--UDP-N-acetylglucosamine O-acyltransferase [Verrucomicrobiota bacterium]